MILIAHACIGRSDVSSLCVTLFPLSALFRCCYYVVLLSVLPCNYLDSTDDTEFAFLDKVGREAVGKPPMNLLCCHHPGNSSTICVLKAARNGAYIPI